MENTAESKNSSNSKVQVQVAKFEQQRLVIFIQNSHKFFVHVLQQEQKARHHLHEFTQRIQTRRFIFGTAIHELCSTRSKLKAEVTKIEDGFQILWEYNATFLKLSNSTNAVCVQMPSLKSVQKCVDDLSDNITKFQTNLFTTLITPLGCLENDLQQLIFSDLAGITSWQQDAQIYGEPRCPMSNTLEAFEGSQLNLR